AADGKDLERRSRARGRAASEAPPAGPAPRKGEELGATRHSMSQLVLDRLKAELGARVLSTTNFRGDEAALVAPADWFAAATFLRDAPACAMNHFVDITAVDYPEREPSQPRFDLVLSLRSLEKKHRIRLKTRLRDGEEVASLVPLWQGADWTEREVWDMFG